MNRLFRVVPLAAALGIMVAGPALAQGALRIAKDEAPTRTWAPEARYPDELRRTRLQGTVIVEAKIDSTGRVDTATVRVVESPDPRFNEPAKEFVVRSRYRAGRVEGKRVAMFVRVPVLFDLYR